MCKLYNKRNLGGTEHLNQGLSQLNKQIISKLLPRAKTVIIRANAFDVKNVEVLPALALGSRWVGSGSWLAVLSLVLVMTSVRTVGVVGVGPLQ